MPPAHASGPVIVVKNESKLVHFKRYTVLYHYLNQVAQQWDIYQGVYTIYLRDSFPKHIEFPPHALGGHIPHAVSYVNVKAVLQSSVDLMYVMAHELGEMAVDPNNDRYGTLNGVTGLIEICDGLNSPYLLDGYQVPAFLTPNDYTN